MLIPQRCVDSKDLLLYLMDGSPKELWKGEDLRMVEYGLLPL